MGKRIEFDAAAREALRRGVDQLAGAVRITLGPRGRNVVIHRRDGAPTITNDGLTISREIELENPFENMGVQLVKEVALKTGEVAGDGTTTATVLAHVVVGEGLKAIAAGSNPMAIKRGIDRSVATVVEELRKRSVQVRHRDDLERVAAVSANNDGAIGALIADALDRVGRQGVVTVEEGRSFETSLEVVEGVRLDRGYLSPYFVTDPDNMAAELDDALLLLTDRKLSTARDLVTAMEHAARMGRPLLVIAEDIEGEALATLVVNRLRGTVQSVGVRAPAMGEERRALLEDLAVLTGATLFTPVRGDTLDAVRPDHFGRVKRVVVDKDSTTLVEGGGRQAEIRERIDSTRRKLDRSESEFDRQSARTRLSRLTGGVAVIHVGAATEVEMRVRRSRVEDALAATRSALEEGVVPGGGVALLRTQAAVRALRLPGDEAVGQRIVARALEEPARQIATNAGVEGAVAVERIRSGEGGFGFNAETCQYGDLVAQGILDAVKVARCALQNAASIGSLVLTTDAIVVDAPEEEGEEDGGAEAEDSDA
jgi:chaperonin GroEL